MATTDPPKIKPLKRKAEDGALAQESGALSIAAQTEQAFRQNLISLRAEYPHIHPISIVSEIPTAEKYDVKTCDGTIIHVVPSVRIATSLDAAGLGIYLQYLLKDLNYHHVDTVDYSRITEHGQRLLGHLDSPKAYTTSVFSANENANYWKNVTAFANLDIHLEAGISPTPAMSNLYSGSFVVVTDKEWAESLLQPDRPVEFQRITEIPTVEDATRDFKFFQTLRTSFPNSLHDSHSPYRSSSLFAAGIFNMPSALSMPLDYMVIDSQRHYPSPLSLHPDPTSCLFQKNPGMYLHLIRSARAAKAAKISWALFSLMMHLSGFATALLKTYPNCTRDDFTAPEMISRSRIAKRLKEDPDFRQRFLSLPDEFIIAYWKTKNPTPTMAEATVNEAVVALDLSLKRFRGDIRGINVAREIFRDTDSRVIHPMSEEEEQKEQ